MDKKNEEILDNHGKNLPHGQSIADRPVDHQDFAPMMTKAQLAMKSDIKDMGEGQFQVTGNISQFRYHHVPGRISRSRKLLGWDFPARERHSEYKIFMYFCSKWQDYEYC